MMTTVGLVSKTAANAVVAGVLCHIDYSLVASAGDSYYSGYQLMQYWAFAGTIIMISAVPCIKIFELFVQYDDRKPSFVRKCSIAMPAIGFIALSFYCGLSVAFIDSDSYHATGAVRTWSWFGAWIAVALFYLGFTVTRIRQPRRANLTAVPVDT